MQEVQRPPRRRGLPGAAARQGGAPEVPGEAQVPLAGVVLRRPDPQHLQHQVEELKNWTVGHQEGEKAADTEMNSISRGLRIGVSWWHIYSNKYNFA